MINPFPLISVVLDIAVEQGSRLDTYVDTLIKSNFSKRVHELAMIILRTLPESYFCYAALTGIGLRAAGLIWGVRLLVVSRPLLRVILAGEWKKDSLRQGFSDSFENLGEAYKKFGPAIVVAASITSMSNYILGFQTQNIMYGLRSILYTATARIAVNAIYSA
ncbi:MAG: hypothetical protein JWO53_1268 [Chlamydiia bacterium]|nr:hypothetical protein [Chlamydiia bacterium]